MRIVVLGAKGFPGVRGAGGVERGTYETCTRIARNHDVTVYERGDARSVRSHGAVTIRTIPFIDRRGLASWSHLIASTWDALRHLRGVDVYHVHCAQNGFICPFLRLTGARVLFHVHGREWRASKWGVMMATLFFVSCLIGALTATRVATVCSPSLLLFHRLLAPFKRKIWLIPNGVPSWPTEPTTGVGASGGRASDWLPNTKPVLLYAGRLVPQKRVDLLVSAARALPSDAVIALAGSTSHSDAYVASIRGEGPDPSRVLWLGQLDQPRLAHLYQTCRAVVLPSGAEGCSNTLLEALAAGCCVVASDLPENRDVLGEAGVFFARGDLTSLERALHVVLTEPLTVERLRRAARARARQLPSWDASADALLALYLGHEPWIRSSALNEAVEPTLDLEKTG